jgi:hypothetical protein
VIRVFCRVLALAILASVAAKADEPVGLEVRKRSDIGGWVLVRVQVTTKVAADGSVLATFHAPKAGSYGLYFTSGPETGKIAMTVRVEKAGPITAKLRPRGR